ncbi:uncharacterized protein HaLaN_00177, partial [Haematococcus lacustris]
MSDGRAHDPMQCIAFLEDRIKHQQRVPIIHTVGFFTDEASPEGRQFLQQLSTITGGTFQEYRPTLNRIYKEGQGFVKYDTKYLMSDGRAHDPMQCIAFLEDRIKHQQRVPIIHTERVAGEQAAYEAELAKVVAHNTDLKARALREYQQLVDAVTARNQAKVDHAKQRYEQAHAEWETSYRVALADWEKYKERVAGEQAAYEAELAKVVAHNTDLKARALREYQQLVDAVTARNQAKVDHAKQRYEQAHAEWETSYRVALADWEKYK